MQVARAPAEGHGRLGEAPQLLLDGFKQDPVGLIRGKVSQHGAVVSRTEPSQMRSQGFGQARLGHAFGAPLGEPPGKLRVREGGKPAGPERGRFLGELALVERGQKFLGAVFGPLHVRLVERIDADEKARRGRGDLPEQELPAQIVEVLEAQGHHRVAGALQGRQFPLRVRLRSVREREAHEEPVVSIRVGGAERLPHDGKDAAPLLPRRFGDELLVP